MAGEKFLALAEGAAARCAARCAGRGIAGAVARGVVGGAPRPLVEEGSDERLHRCHTPCVLRPELLELLLRFEAAPAQPAQRLQLFREPPACLRTANAIDGLPGKSSRAT